MDVPGIKDVQRLRLEPGDRLIVHTDSGEVTPEQAATMRARLRAVLGIGEDIPIAVLGPGTSLSVVSHEPA